MIRRKMADGGERYLQPGNEEVLGHMLILNRSVLPRLQEEGHDPAVHIPEAVQGRRRG